MDSPREAKRAKMGDASSDFLHLYESGDSYNCTFRAISKSGASKDFKCHKKILADANLVFMKMLFGFFAEARMGPDDPIIFKDVVPHAFDFMMRYLYSNEKEKNMAGMSLDAIILIYRISHEMQVESLVVHLDKLLKKTKAPKIFAVFNLYQTINCQECIAFSKEILATGTAEALESKHWLKMRMSSVHEFLRLLYLQANEADLVNALIKWGKHNTQSDDELLRDKILPSLKLIRFAGMTCEEFAQLCQGPLGQVLSHSEKSLISASIESRNTSLMPAEFDPTIPVQRQKPFAVCRFPFTLMEGVSGSTSNIFFSFKVNRNATLVGIQVKGRPVTVSDLWFTLECVSDKLSYGRGKCASKISHEGEKFSKFFSKCHLTADTIYNLKFSCTEVDYKKCKLPRYTLPGREKVFTSDWLSVTIKSPKTDIVMVESLLFELRRDVTSA